MRGGGTIVMAAAAEYKIVIVEDEGLIAADLESRLKSAGYIVPGTADSAQPALTLIRETSPDLVLMDIRLKGEQDGIYVADMIRKQLDIPVVYLTAYEDRETLQRASQTQAYGYIKKPIVSASLKGSIEMAIAKHRYERGLREERDWAISSFSGVASAVIVTDANSRISYLNAQAEQLVGWSADKALRRPAAEVLRLSYRDTGKPVQDLLTLAMRQGETLPLPPGTMLQGSAERLYAIDGHVAPRWREGRADGTVITFTDVTLYRFENEQMRQDHKHEALARMADGIIRHLPSLDALAESSTNLLAALPPGSPLRETAETIQKATMDASVLGRHLGGYIQPPEFEYQRVRLDEVLKNLSEASNLVHSDLVLVMDPAEPIYIQTDEWQLLRALANVLLHARVHMQAGSSVVVDLSSGEPEQLGQWARIRARYVSAQEDTAALERVFEPAWSGSSEDLHVTYTLVKKMGGMVAALLEAGNTVSLEIYLPRVEVAATGALIKPESPDFLIEPNREIQRLLPTISKRLDTNS
jgi:AmiR/NasT family two-component response regulator/signal transduction histidine kinase